MARTNHWKNAKTKPLFAAGVMVCASVLIAPAARADDSLWGKAMNTIGLGGNDQSGQAAPASPQPVVSPPQAAPASPQATVAPPQTSPKAVAPPLAVAPPQPTVQSQKPKQDAASGSPVPQDGASQAAAPAQGPNLLTNWFGWGHGDAGNSGAPLAQTISATPSQKAINPGQPVAAPPPPPPPRAAEPSMWDKMLGSVGVGNGGASLDTINYNERSKLNVPKERVLPPPQPVSETPASRAANSDYLVKPPSDYLEKARGADGTVSGLRDSDQAKDKKFFGLF